MRPTIAIPLGLLWLGTASRIPHEARACTPLFAQEHAIDMNEVGVDITPPSAIVAIHADISRMQEKTVGGGVSSCGNLGVVRLVITPGSDDRTAPEQLGYRLVLNRGALPGKMQLSAAPLRAAPLSSPNPSIFLYWGDDAREDVNFTLQVFPVDLAGNEGPPSEVEVVQSAADAQLADEAGAGCNAGQAGLPLLLGLVLARGTRSRWAMRPEHQPPLLRP